MEKKNLPLVGIFLLCLVFLGAVAYQIYLVMQKEDEGQITNTPQSISSDDFTFEYTYTENNLWSYTVKGTLPNPCYTISTEAIVAESYPEQVYVTSTITPPNEDQVCAQVIKDVKEIGEFTASESATVSFKVVNK